VEHFVLDSRLWRVEDGPGGLQDPAAPENRDLSSHPQDVYARHVHTVPPRRLQEGLFMGWRQAVRLLVPTARGARASRSPIYQTGIFIGV
jgi:hypothetical protein